MAQKLGLSGGTGDLEHHFPEAAATTSDIHEPTPGLKTTGLHLSDKVVAAIGPGRAVDDFH